MSEALLSTIVVSWASRDEANTLLATFPADPRHELVVVDNGGELAVGSDGNRRVLAPGANLGYGGGCNYGAQAARGERLLFLNPDVAPIDAAYEEVRRAFDQRAEASGIVPRLVGRDGGSQHRWQLRELPTAVELLAHAFFWNPATGAPREPGEGTLVEQPAAAALALRRDAFDAVGGFDERFHPAWFEDVDLARRLRAQRARLVYWPRAAFVHGGGGSVATLGYGRFLSAYDRNLGRYLRLHHGRGWELAFRALVPLGALARVALLPLRRPARAASRVAAARDLLGVARGAFSGWSEPTKATP